MQPQHAGTQSQSTPIHHYSLIIFLPLKETFSSGLFIVNTFRLILQTLCFVAAFLQRGVRPVGKFVEIFLNHKTPFL
jgi:hypothetical protein